MIHHIKAICMTLCNREITHEKKSIYTYLLDSLYFISVGKDGNKRIPSTRK